MTDIREYDFRHSWTLEILQALDRGAQKVARETPDGLDLLERVEQIVGLGFVALQSYIAGTEADLRAVFPTAALTSDDLRCMNCTELAGATCIEAIWAGGNYYKHHDQWPDWNATGWRTETVLTLSRLGICQSTEFPCVEIQRVLGPESTGLVDLLRMVSEWRESWFSQLRTGVLPNKPLQRA